jgi:hypothetical protein
MAFGQRGFDRGLTLQQPVQRGVEFVLIDLTEVEHFAEARCGGGRRQRTGGGELGRRVEDATDEEGEDKVSATIVIRAKDTIEADLARDTKRGSDMTVWQAADHGEGVTLGGDDRAAFEDAAQTLDVGCGPIGQIAQSALTDLAAFAVALAQKDRGGASSDSEWLRCTCRTMSTSGGNVQVSNMILHGYRFRRLRRLDINHSFPLRSPDHGSRKRIVTRAANRDVVQSASRIDGVTLPLGMRPRFPVRSMG